MCECIPGPGGEVCEPRGLHTYADQAAAVMEAADHPCVAPTAPQDQGHPPQPQVRHTLKTLVCEYQGCHIHTCTHAYMSPQLLPTGSMFTLFFHPL